MKYSSSFIPLAFVLLIVGCGGGSGGGTSGVANALSLTDVSFSGSVGDGPISSATIIVRDKTGQELGRYAAGTSTNYSINLKVKGNAFPLSLHANGGIDLVSNTVPDFVMAAAAAKPSAKTVNINPYTTLIFKIAEEMGEVNSENLAAAKTIVLTQLNFGLDESVFPDPLSTPTTDGNIAHVIKASETFGEMIRRTRDAYRQTGQSVDGDDIVAILAADLRDGSLDGQGGSQVNARVAALAHVAIAQVNLEAMNNRLKVNGVEATATMDNVIRTVAPSSSQTTADVVINQAIIDQTLVSIDAVQSVYNDDDLDDLRNTVSAISAGSLASDVPIMETTAVKSVETQVISAPDSEIVSLLEAVSADSNQPANVAPVISGSPSLVVSENSSYNFTPVASDADGDSLTFSIANKPSWASFNSNTGKLSGTPDYSDAGSYNNIVISVTDGQSSTSLASFAVTVVNVNRAPSISGAATGSVSIESLYSFTPSAADADGDSLTFSISNKPSWATFNTSTGKLSGTPLLGHAGEYSNIVISVSDGASSTSLGAFTITVIANSTNNAPVISGVPASSLLAGDLYSFRPSASDADGDSLTFSISNKPTWASFNTSTGELSGLPGLTHIGDYDNIIITVSDGTDSRSLNPFSVSVLAESQQGRNVSWQAPLTDTAGNIISLSELGGYKVYLGSSATSLSLYVVINNNVTTSYNFSSLSPGTYYVAVTSFDSDGVESELSQIVSMVVP